MSQLMFNWAIIALFVIMDIQNDTDCRVHNSLLILKDKQKNIIIFFCKMTDSMT